MANLKATYMGIELKNPLVAGACSLTSNMDTIKKIESCGASAVIIKSLFEEQINLQRHALEEDMHQYDGIHAEMTSIFPELQYEGPEEHLMWVRKAKEAVGIPVIASLNAVDPSTWSKWALLLEETGADGLELNFFSILGDNDADAQSIENDQISVLKDILGKVKIPVSVKLSSFYTNTVNFIKKLDAAGVKGFILFNRFFHPVINIENETSSVPFNLSGPEDYRLALRFSGLLYDQGSADICASNGIHSADQAIQILLAGADVFQVVSTLYLNKVDVIGTILDGIKSWMDKKGYSSLGDFRGKLSAKNVTNKYIYKRAQYAKLLLKYRKYLQR